MQQIVELSAQAFQPSARGFVERSEVQGMLDSLDGTSQVQLDGGAVFGWAPAIFLRLVERVGQHEVCRWIRRVTVDHEPAKGEHSLHGLAGAIELIRVALAGGDLA